MRRREFFILLGGTAATWHRAARAEPGVRVRRIGMLLNLAEDDPETRARVAVFLSALQKLGWTVGQNLRLDYRWGEGDADRHRINAAQLVALAPDAILAHGSPILAQAQRATHTVPIVFVSVTDPVAGGFVASLARPGGNITGFTVFEYSLAVKWLELLKQIAPHVTRAAVLRDPSLVTAGGWLGAMQAVAPGLGLELIPIDVRDTSEIERAITVFAGLPNGGLIVTGTALAQIHREVIITLSTRHRLPAVYSYRLFVRDGGLISYGPDLRDQYRRAAGYVDRIFRGEKPADLPVQAPTKFELVVNLKTAKALDLTVPESILARADEVIE